MPPPSSSSSFGKAFQRRLYSVFLDRSTVIAIIVLSGIVFVSTLRDGTVLTTEIKQCLEGGSAVRDLYPTQNFIYSIFTTCQNPYGLILSFGEAWLEWSADKYAAVFNHFSDNIAGRSLQGRLCQYVVMSLCTSTSIS